MFATHILSNKKKSDRILQYTAEFYYEEFIGKMMWQAAKNEQWAYAIIWYLLQTNYVIKENERIVFCI